MDDYRAGRIPELGEIIEIGYECDAAIRATDRIRRALTRISRTDTRKIFLNSEGGRMVQRYTDTVGDTTSAAYEGGTTQSVTVTEDGGRGRDRADHGKKRPGRKIKGDGVKGLS